MSIYSPGRPSKFNPVTGAGKKPPASPGEYRIREDGGDITYVGETNDLSRRMRQHIGSGKLSKDNPSATFEWKTADGRSTSKTRRDHEREKIKQHSPSGNKSRGGEGRRAKK